MIVKPNTITSQDINTIYNKSILDVGLKVNEKWNTDNLLTTEVSIEDQAVKGLKTTFESAFNPSSNKKKGLIKNNFKNDMVNLNLDVNFDYAGPTMRGAAVVG